MHTTMIRPVPARSVQLAAKRANALRRAQTADNRAIRAFEPVLDFMLAKVQPTAKVTEVDKLHIVAQNAEKVHNAQIVALRSTMDNLDNSPIMHKEAYRTAKATFPAMPAFWSWVREQA